MNTRSVSSSPAIFRCQLSYTALPHVHHCSRAIPLDLVIPCTPLPHDCRVQIDCNLQLSPACVDPTLGCPREPWHSPDTVGASPASPACSRGPAALSPCRKTSQTTFLDT